MTEVLIELIDQGGLIVVIAVLLAVMWVMLKAWEDDRTFIKQEMMERAEAMEEMAAIIEDEIRDEDQ